MNSFTSTKEAKTKSISSVIQQYQSVKYFQYAKKPNAAFMQVNIYYLWKPEIHLTSLWLWLHIFIHIHKYINKSKALTFFPS